MFHSAHLGSDPGLELDDCHFVRTKAQIFIEQIDVAVVPHFEHPVKSYGTTTTTHHLTWGRHRGDSDCGWYGALRRQQGECEQGFDYQRYE